MRLLRRWHRGQRVFVALLAGCTQATVRGADQDGNAAASAAGGSAQRFVGPSSPNSRDDNRSAPGEALAPILVPYTPGPDRVHERLDRDFLFQGGADQPTELQTIFFPPAPPVLGAPLPPMGVFSDAVPRALMPFVAEPFYAPLSTRLSEEDLGRRLRSRLDAYQDQKLALLGALRGQLEELRNADPVRRKQVLTAFAATQAADLIALEKTADELRREFFRARFLGGGGDWNRYRSWHLKPEDVARERPEMRRLELRVLRAAEFYQEGLSPAQRRLVRELTMELAASLNLPGAGSGLPPDDHSRVIFFSPDTARIALPDDLPAGVDADLAQYSREKNALKRALRDRLIALDADRSPARRARALQDLADEQTARLAGLEDLAEKIRGDLAPRMTRTGGPVPAPLPATIERRLAAYLRDKADLQKMAQERVADAVAKFEQEGAANDPADRAARRAGVVRAAVDAFNVEFSGRISALNTEAEFLRGEIVQLTSGSSDADSTRSVDALLTDFSRAFKHQQLASLYADYRTAVLEPGLSPEQRRLLFGGAMVDLKLPGAIRDRQVPPDEVMLRP